jgi:hypothetical protein
MKKRIAILCAALVLSACAHKGPPETFTNERLDVIAARFEQVSPKHPITVSDSVKDTLYSGKVYLNEPKTFARSVAANPEYAVSRLGNGYYISMAECTDSCCEIRGHLPRCRFIAPPKKKPRGTFQMSGTPGTWNPANREKP